MFVLCLDKPISKDLFKGKTEESVRAVQCLTGISIETNAGNRWYDKTLQYFISYDGFVGLNYEHTACEGGPAGVLHDHVIKYVAEKEYEGCDRRKQFPKAQHLEFELPPGIDDSIIVAARTVKEMTENINMESFTFDDFGTDEIKGNKMSPDSFIQTAMQLAFYRLHRKPPVHYEVTGLRRFRQGRTERTCCTCVESVEFARTLLGDDPKHQKREAMMKAISAHKQLVNEAATGQGVMRHLSGLKTLASLEGLDMPEIFNNIAYTRSSNFNLNTSQISLKTASCGCYTPIISEGYGICYNPRPKDILLSCASANSCKETNTQAFVSAVKKSFCEMMELVSNDNEA